MTMRITLFLCAIVLIGSSIWIKLPETWHNHHAFLEQDYLLVLGLTILTSLAASFIKSDKPSRFMSKVSSFMERHWRWFAVCLSVFAFLTAVIANKLILHSFFNSADEHSCYFLAECIRNGRLWADPHPLSEFFEVVHVENKGGKWFSVYPFGWPLIWAVAKQLNAGDLINPLMGAISIFLILTTAKKIFGFNVAILWAFITVTSAFFIFNVASYYSVTACLLCFAIFLYAFCRWKNEPKSIWMIIAGFAVGYGVSTRYITMTAVTTPFLFYEFVSRIKQSRKLDRGHIFFISIFILFIVFNLSFNYLITGNPFDAPNHYHHNWERLGFKKEYTPYDAFIFFVTRMFYLMDWTSAALPVLYIASLFYLWKRTTAIQKLFQFSFLALAFGYVFYYSWGGNQYGPRYYFVAFPLMAISIAFMLEIIWKQSTFVFRNAIVGLCIAILAGNFYTLQKQGVYFERASKERKDLYKTTQETISRPAIVFIKEFIGDTLVMSQEDAVRNHPQLNDLILYAHDLGEKNVQLMKHYPERTNYRAVYDRGSKRTVLTPI